MSLMRRLRGLAGMVLVWALAWIPLGLLSTTIMSLVFTRRFPPLGLLLYVVGPSALAGAASGLIFGGLLALAERNRTLDTLSPRRFALWGVLAAVLPPALQLAWAFTRHPTPWNAPGLLPMLGSVFGLSGLLGAGCAGCLLYVTRRGSKLGSSARVDELPAAIGDE